MPFADTTPGNMPENMKECIEACWSCREHCQRILFTHCLPMGGPHAEASHVALMTDCIEICQIAADFMTRQSPRHALTCGICAEICAACAESCAALEGEEMSECAEACRHCAETCEEMAASSLKGQPGPVIGHLHHGHPGEGRA